jgi:hypothetical protein
MEIKSCTLRLLRHRRITGDVVDFNVVLGKLKGLR